jgi:quercetin dioxygenase-like cupin family protein
MKGGFIMMRSIVESFLSFLMPVLFFSMHYHLLKKETWFVQEGSFELRYINVDEGSTNSIKLTEGDSIVIERGQPHQLIALEDSSIILEVSTEHFDSDSYRITREKYPL